MLVQILALLHHATTLLFGIYISAAFLGIKMNRKNILTLLGFSCTVGVVYIFSFLQLGVNGTQQIYPLIIHLPLILFITFYYKYNPVLAVLSVFTAYLCCQISNWVGIAALTLTHSDRIYYSIRIMVTVTVFILLIIYIADATALLIQKSTKSLMILSIMPCTYYFYDYITHVYTLLLYSGLKAVVEFLGFLLCIAYLLFLFFYFREYEEKCQLEQHNQLMQMQQEQKEKELKAIYRSEQAISILRHDMRHFLSNISIYIKNGETESAMAYINEIMDSIDKTSIQKYCKNKIVNIILSSHENEISANQIDLQYSIRIPEKLPFSDVDITAILSNALENAIAAVLPLAPEQRHIKLSLHMNDDKLLISVKNTFAEAPVLCNGMPKAKKIGHGLGTQSICHVTEKLKGNYQFSIADEWFVLQVIL